MYPNVVSRLRRKSAYCVSVESSVACFLVIAQTTAQARIQKFQLGGATVAGGSSGREGRVAVGRQYRVA